MEFLNAFEDPNNVELQDDIIYNKYIQWLYEVGNEKYLEAKNKIEKLSN